MMAYTSLASTMRCAARMTCSSSGLPPTSCNTFGSCDLSLVPLPAAMMATARRGVSADASFDAWESDFAEEQEGLAFDFFISNSIYLWPSVDGYFRLDGYARKCSPTSRVPRQLRALVP